MSLAESSNEYVVILMHAAGWCVYASSSSNYSGERGFHLA